MLQAARQWYSAHLEKTPLERVRHRPEAPPALREPKFQRLEKRVAALLMSAIPASQQEEVIAGKDINTISILGKLMLSYQPGGLTEKAAILQALDSPEEAPGLTQAVMGLRKWLRWHRRAGEVGVVRPDATIQVKGLGRLMKKVLKDNGDLAFRIQLAKSSLQIDTTPTETNVMTYAHHLLAELEQVAHQDKRKREDKVISTDPKIKKLEDAKGEGKNGGKERQASGQPCRFFLTEGGCKKGKACSWPHILDDQKRCWTCGSTQHFSPACDRQREGGKDPGGLNVEKGGKSGDGKGFRPSAKQARKEDGGGEDQLPRDEGSEDAAQSDTVKSLLEEANRMLKALSSSRGSDDVEKSKGDKLAAMQLQLDELRKMKTLRLSRISGEEEKHGLLDSGATHPMRGAREQENIDAYERVKVTLADGQQVDMRMNAAGVMVAEHEGVEPIVPMSLLVGRLGYTITWEKGRMRVCHPHREDIKVKIVNGCPQISRVVALKLIDEVESGVTLKRIQMNDREEEWLKGLVQAHPALRELPDAVKNKLVVTPDEDLRRLPGCNRRKRRTLEKEGFVAHLYAGPDHGYTLARALKEVGGNCQRLVEIDKQREDAAVGEHDMLSDQGPYPALVRAALDGTLKGLIMGPNCRTRSVLRHYPRPDWPG